MNCFVISIKRNFFTILVFLFIICLITFSNSNLESAKSGITLWATSVLPSLFPFFIATELLYHTNFINILGKFLTKFMRPVFNTPGESAICVILGTLSGYPIGAKLACNLKENGICSKAESERLLAFTNNSGPLFIISTVGIAMFSSSKIGFLLLITHLTASLTVGFLFRNWKKSQDTVSKTFKKLSSKQTQISISNLGEILGDAIKSSINLILTIGGFIVLFSVVISILNNIFPSLMQSPLLCGILEITNGLKLVSTINNSLYFKVILSSVILGFGGISVMFQIYSVISKYDLSIKPYIYGKCLQAILSGIYTLIALQAFPNILFN